AREWCRRRNQGGGGARPPVAGGAVLLGVDDEVRDRDDGAVDRRADVGSRSRTDIEHVGAPAALELIPNPPLLGGSRDAAPEAGEQALVGLGPDGADFHRATLL